LLLNPGVVERNRDAIAEIRALLPTALSPLVLGRVQARADLYRKAGAPADLAQDVALVRALASARETACARAAARCEPAAGGVFGAASTQAIAAVRWSAPIV
jgi:NAD-specific glutamate dehydrogenase